MLCGLGRATSPRVLVLALSACGPTVGIPESGTSDVTSSFSGGDSSAAEPSTSDSSATTVLETGESVGSSSGASGDVAICHPEPIEGPCSLVCQDCEKGDRCGVVRSGPSDLDWTKACVPDSGQLPEIGEACSVGEDGIDPCEPPSACYGDRCEATCSPGSRDYSCEEPLRCVGLAAFGAESQFGVCLLPCDPFEPCPPLATNQICYPIGATCDLALDASCFPLQAEDTTFCHPRPQYPDVHGHGWPCERQSDCDEPPAACAPASLVADCSAAACCAELCDLLQPGTCDFASDGETCEPLFDQGASPLGLETLGICRL